MIGEGLLDRILFFANRYPDPFDPADAVVHTVVISQLLANIRVHYASFGLSEARLRDFEDQLAGVSESVSEVMAWTGNSEKLQTLTANGYGELSAGWPWLDSFSFLQWRYVGDTGAGPFVFRHQRSSFRRRFLEYGRLLAEHDSAAPELEEWYEDVLGYHPQSTFVHGFYMEALRGGSGETGDLFSASLHEAGDFDTLDVESLQAWSEWIDSVEPDHALMAALIRRFKIREAQAICQLSGNTSVIRHAIDAVVSDVVNGVEYSDVLLSNVTLQIHESPTDFCLSHQAKVEFFQSVRELNLANLNSILDGPLAVDELRRVPLVVKAETWDGQDFDLEAFRGRYVLLQFWDVQCAACFSVIPELKALETQFGSAGFSIVSVNVDSEERRRYVQRVQEGYDLDWPILKAHRQWQMWSDRFGWGLELPQYLLLDSDGLLVADTSTISVRDGELQELLEGIFQHSTGNLH